MDDIEEIGIFQFAQRYVVENQLRGRTPIYSARRFADLVGNLPVTKITEQHFQTYREKCLERKLCSKTIESSIGNLLTLIKAATGKFIERGKKLKIPRPCPKPVELEDITAVYIAADGWLKQWLALTYWTGLRLADSIDFHRQLSESNLEQMRTLEMIASKTQRTQRWPFPEWLKKHLKPMKLPYSTGCIDNAKKFIRLAIAEHCRMAGVKVWTPKQLRQRSITEWSRSNATAGAIVHGSGLGVLGHYIDPMQILESAADGVRIPAGMKPARKPAASAAEMLNQLDEAKRAAVEQMLTALVNQK